MRRGVGAQRDGGGVGRDHIKSVHEELRQMHREGRPELESCAPSSERQSEGEKRHYGPTGVETPQALSGEYGLPVLEGLPLCQRKGESSLSTRQLSLSGKV